MYTLLRMYTLDSLKTQWSVWKLNFIYLDVVGRTFDFHETEYPDYP